MSLVESVEVEPGLFIITLSNGKLNPLSVAVLGELHQACLDISAEKPKAAVITGGEKHFAAGADISEFGGTGDDGKFRISGTTELGEIGEAFLRSINSVAALPCPTIAAINGIALGGGCEVALACDFRVASERALLGQPEILLGIIPGGGGTQRLARLVGPAKAKDLIFSGRTIKAQEALEIGLVDRISDGDAVASAQEWAAEFATGPRAAAAMAKQAIDNGLAVSLDEGLGIEQRMFVSSFMTDDAAAGLESFLTNGPGHADFSR